MIDLKMILSAVARTFGISSPGIFESKSVPHLNPVCQGRTPTLSNRTSIWTSRQTIDPAESAKQKKPLSEIPETPVGISIR